MFVLFPSLKNISRKFLSFTGLVRNHLLVLSISAFTLIVSFLLPNLLRFILLIYSLLIKLTAEIIYFKFCFVFLKCEL